MTYFLCHVPSGSQIDGQPNEKSQKLPETRKYTPRVIDDQVLGGRGQVRPFYKGVRKTKEKAAAFFFFFF